MELSRMFGRWGQTAFLAAILLWAGSAPAQNHVIAPQDYVKWKAVTREEVRFQILWGHTYLHLWDHASEPDELVALPPGGGLVELRGRLEPLEVRNAFERPAKAFQFQYTPREPGDHIIAMTSPHVWDDEAGVFYRDYIKLVLHTDEGDGWQRPAGHPLEIIPYTRPYGLLPGQSVTVQALQATEALEGADISFEQYRLSPPSPLEIPDEELYHFKARTDADGMATFGLHQSGWFGITVEKPTDSVVEKDEFKGPLIERATLWIYVNPDRG